MALLYATLQSIDALHPPLELPLSLQEPELNGIELARCPNVLEDARYDLELKLDLTALEQELITYFKDQSGEQAAQDASYLTTGEALARHDLGLLELIEQDVQVTPIGPRGANSSSYQAASLFAASGLFKGIARISLKVNEQERGYFNFHLENTAPGRHANAILKAQLSSDSRFTGSKQQLFLMQYDTVTLSIIIMLTDGSTLTLYSNILLCASQNKSDNRNISQILTELSSMPNDTILELMFTPQRKQENLNSNFFGGHRAFQSLSSYVALLEQVLSCYRDNYNYFRNMAKHMLVKAEVVTAFDQVRMLTHKSQRWLTQNLQVLSEVVPEQAVISYLDKNYLPLQMQSTTTVKSYDTYENRVVVGFLQMVLHNSSKIAQDYKTFLYEHLDALKALRAKLNERGLCYEVPIITLKFLQLQKCEHELNHLYEVIGDLSTLYRNYAQLFKLKDVLLKQLPRKAKAFQEIKPYAQVFYTINRWFHYGEFSLQKDMLFLQGKTLDKLFEYYCLYRLLDMLIKSGFTPVAGESSFTFDYALSSPTLQVSDLKRTSVLPDQTKALRPGSVHSLSFNPLRPLERTMSAALNYHYDDGLANTYVLSRGKQKVTLYYQPIVSTMAFYNQIFAFRTNCATKNGRNYQDNFYTPDFILKFSSGENLPGDDDYIIIDAKFSRRDNVVNYHLQELINKYCTNTAIAVLRRTQVLKDQHNQEDWEEQRLSRTIVGNSGLQMVDTKPPRMVLALYGRITTEGEFDANAAPRYWRYHNSPMAELFMPSTNIGMLELKSNDRATEFLWAELMRTLPYLEQSSKKAPPADQTAALKA